MKIIYNNIVPFKGFRAINLFGVIFARKSSGRITPTTMRHEKIHTAQMKELLYIGFYVLYFMEWLFRLVTTKNAYKNISFEREAYSNQGNVNYLSTRKHFAQWRRKV